MDGGEVEKNKAGREARISTRSEATSLSSSEKHDSMHTLIP